jgi:predicted flap endonuclease-1-like 5' DNA nuclease
MADLFRIRGVGEEYSDLLEAAGVDTVVELAKRVPEHLHAKMLEVNGEKKLVRRPPGLSMVESWVKEAKTLPRKIEY